MATPDSPAETTKSSAPNHVWPFLLVGFTACVVLTGIAYFEPLACLNATQGSALSRWCQDGTSLPTAIHLLGLSFVGIVIGLAQIGLPAQSVWTSRLGAIAWTSVSAGVIGELVLVISVPSS